MPNIRQCFSWWCYRDHGVDDVELLRAACDIGYGGVEMIDEKYWQIVHDMGMEIVSDNCGASIEAGLNDPANHPPVLDDLRKNLVKAHDNKVRSLIVFSGNRRDGLSEADGIKYTVDGLAAIAPEAEAAGVDINIELLNSKVDHPGYQCDHTGWAASAVSAVNSPRVKILYDIYHMQIMEGDLISTIRKNHERIGHYHTAGVPGRNDIDDNQEINYPPIYRAIAATGYNGYIGHEFIPFADPVAALRIAFDQCKSALE